jgi:hypothetical protein
VPDAAPLHDLLGLYQRLIVLAVIFPCRIVLSIRLLQVAGGRRRCTELEEKTAVRR